jgi:hypothetical protein
MRFDRSSTFGYPVLRPENDDYVNSAIQSSLNATADIDLAQIQVSYDIKLSVPELNQLVKDGKAVTIIYGECRDTWFDITHYPETDVGSFTIPKNMVNGQLVLTSLVVAKTDIPSYRSKKFNPEYGDATFEIQSGEILVIDHPQSFYITREAFKNVTSLFDYQVNQNLSIGEWDLSLDDDRIKIDVHPAQLPILRSAEGNSKNKSVLLSGLFLPVLVEILNTMDASDEHCDRHWYQIIEQKRAGLSTAISKSKVRSAQALLRQPLARLNTNMGWIDET